MTNTTYTRSRQITKPGYIRVADVCHRCGGDGVWKGWYHGTCYRCGGNGQEPNGVQAYAYPADWTDEQCADHDAKRRARSRAAADRKEAKKVAARDAFLAERPELAEVFADWQSRDTEDTTYGVFVGDVLRRLLHYGTLSDRQVDAVVSAAHKDVQAAQERLQTEAEAEAAKRPVPVGTVTVEGDIVSVKDQPNHFGYGSTLKMLVVGEGWKVWGTAPSSILGVGIRGKRVRFVATVEASTDDPTFGYFSRPRKAEIIGEASPEPQEDRD